MPLLAIRREVIEAELVGPPRVSAWGWHWRRSTPSSECSDLPGSQFPFPLEDKGSSHARPAAHPRPAVHEFRRVQREAPDRASPSPRPPDRSPHHRRASRSAASALPRARCRDFPVSRQRPDRIRHYHGNKCRTLKMINGWSTVPNMPRRRELIDDMEPV